MRVLYAVHQFMPEYIGGTEQDTWEVAERMRARDHEVAIVHRAPGRAGLVRTQRDAIPVYRIEAGSMNTWSLFRATFGSPRVMRQFQTVFRAFQPDLVHFQHLRGLPPRVVGWVKDQGCPVVISLRDFWFVCPNAQLLNYETGDLCTTPGEPFHCARCGLVRIGLRSLLPVAAVFVPLMVRRNQILRAVMEQAHALFTYSGFVQTWYAERGIAMGNLHYIPRGIPRPEMPPAPRGDDSKIRFVYIGGLSWQKGVHVLIEAFNGLDQRAELLIAGDETQYVDYVRALHAAAHHPGIKFLGRIDRDTVWRTLAAADAVVVPSLWYETFSMLTHEAFAMHVPVIASDHGALAEAVDHGVDGLLVPPGDVAAWRKAMQRFVESDALRVRLRAGVTSPLTMRAYLDHLEDYYRRIER
ncbi:MAG: glycosyltransferase [Anaerolineae bacterium]